MNSSEKYCENCGEQHMGLTYRELKQFLSSLSEEQLDDTAVIYIEDTVEAYDITSVAITDEGPLIGFKTCL